MADGVFDGLRRGVRGAGKDAEGSRVDEAAPVKGAHVHGHGFSLNDVARGSEKVAGNAVAGGKIVGGARGHIADGHVPSRVEHAGDDFVERAVAADADYALKLARAFRDRLSRLPRFPGLQQIGDQAIRFEDGQHLAQTTARLHAAGAGIEDDQLPVHGKPPFQAQVACINCG